MGYFTPAFGVLAGLAGIADTIPYVRDTVRGSTRPHRGSWLIWGVLAIVACVAQLADGASWSAVMTGIAMMTPKVRRDPHSETLATYALASVGGALATGAVGMFDLSLLAYPAYYCLANGALAILIYRQRAACSQKVP